MIFSKPPICESCKHLNADNVSCKAFPKQNPEEICWGDNKHKKPLKGQGDKIVFKKKDCSISRFLDKKNSGGSPISVIVKSEAQIELDEYRKSGVAYLC